MPLRVERVSRKVQLRGEIRRPTTPALVYHTTYHEPSTLPYPTPSTLMTPNGRSWNPCCHRPSPADYPSNTPAGKSSAPSATSCTPAPPGVCCPTTCRPTASCSTTTSPGSRSAMPCASKPSRAKAAIPNPAPPFMGRQAVKTAEKRGIAAATRAKSDGAQAPYCDGHGGIAAVGGGASGGCAGAGRCPAVLQELAGRFPRLRLLGLMSGIVVRCRGGFRSSWAAGSAV